MNEDSRLCASWFILTFPDSLPGNNFCHRPETIRLFSCISVFHTESLRRLYCPQFELQDYNHNYGSSWKVSMRVYPRYRLCNSIRTEVHTRNYTHSKSCSALVFSLRKRSWILNIEEDLENLCEVPDYSTEGCFKFFNLNRTHATSRESWNRNNRKKYVYYFYIPTQLRLKVFFSDQNCLSSSLLAHF